MTVTSIDEKLVLISERGWDEADAVRQASAIASAVAGAVVLWDEGEEDWLQVLSAGTVSYVHAKKPFVMLLGEFGEALLGKIEESVVTLTVDSWTERSLSADVDTLRRAFPGRVLPDALPSRSAEAFSAEELWFATI